MAGLGVLQQPFERTLRRFSATKKDRRVLETVRLKSAKGALAHPCFCGERSSDVPLLAIGATALNNCDQQVVYELNAGNLEPLFHPQQPPLNERIQRLGRNAPLSQAFQRPLQRDALPEAGLGDQLFFDEGSQSWRLISKCALIELLEHAAAAA